MDETLPLFHQQPYLKHVECRVERLERDDSGLPYALLSETVFYPQGGGQLGDRGQLNIASQEADGSPRVLEVVTTKKKDQQIRHYLDIDDQVFELMQHSPSRPRAIATLAWPLRYRQMRIHSAMHLMHCMLEQTLGRPLAHPIRSPLSDEGGENQYEFIGEFDDPGLQTGLSLVAMWTMVDPLWGRACRQYARNRAGGCQPEGQEKHHSSDRHSLHGGSIVDAEQAGLWCVPDPDAHRQGAPEDFHVS
ncbi:hypothetical protein AO265_23245, partial [Pseudomonas sp. ABAC61]